MGRKMTDISSRPLHKDRYNSISHGQQNENNNIKVQGNDSQQEEVLSTQEHPTMNITNPISEILENTVNVVYTKPSNIVMNINHFIPEESPSNTINIRPVNGHQIELNHSNEKFVRKNDFPQRKTMIPLLQQ